ncbi:hypothetical protein KDJ56_07430 [Brevibacillus composti]|uniref:Uncharacterized protein n=1 Tax=Brevibacillus composti TaxID=2796470 RepID=A0A7T5ENA3_9BACL|nr:hypothetical protein [Brevibacillus composti]QQE75759.1 hypothetical protein JD108_07750 [Brevibacillus composti]QUO42785.1 hypothetical protein KDJ56_07430 [Brevibacillus composti]
MAAVFGILFYIFWFVITGYIALKPRSAWEILGKWQARRYPSRHYFMMMRLFAVFAFFGPLIWFLTQL